ncbi:hypothetical protein, partial [Escherichia coli]|uniref:hypothetical protein n=1 Tax=Escherichia coli TaxID=562 RepID=UPI001BDB8B4B
LLQYIEFACFCRPDKAFTPHPARSYKKRAEIISALFIPAIRNYHPADLYFLGQHVTLYR